MMKYAFVFATLIVLYRYWKSVNYKSSYIRLAIFNMMIWV